MTENNTVKLPVGSRIVTIKGIDYVARHEYWWDKESKRSRQKRTYIGKVVDGKFVPNATYAAKQELARLKDSVKQPESFDSDKSAGATALLLAAASESGMTEDMRSRFGEEKAAVAVSTAVYTIDTNSGSLSCFNAWAASHALPVSLPKKLTSQRLSEFTKAIGEAKNEIFGLFRKRVERLPENEYLSFDSTHIPSQSRNLTDTRKGPSKRGGFEKQIGFALLYGQTSGLPVMFRRFPGNVTDIKTLRDLLVRWEEIGLGKTVTPVFDRGYCSRENIRLLRGMGYKFIMAARTDHLFIRKAFENHSAEIRDTASTIREDDIRGIRCKVQVPAIEGDDSPCEVWAYCFFSPSKQGAEEIKFFKSLVNFEEDWKLGNASAKSRLLKYFMKPAEGPGECELVRNEDRIRDHMRFMGFFAMLSDGEMDLHEAYRIYRERDTIEKCFCDIKSNAGLNTTRAHDEMTVDGRLLIGFVAATILSWLSRKMNEETVVDGVKMKPLRHEYSLRELLMELEQIRHYRSSSGKAWFGEVIKRHRQIYQRLGLEKYLVDPTAYN